MRTAFGVLFLTMALAGCAESQFAGSMFYLRPYKFEDKTCAQLKQEIAGLKVRVRDSLTLREKAALSPGGTAVGTMTYSPDYNRASWELKLFENEYARKNCTDEPPPPPPPAAGPPAVGPSSVIAPR